MKIYENVIIGNFLYTLGMEIGLKRVYNKPAMINLLQQTPCDKYLGDMLLEYPGVVRLIEFKNKASSLKKEKDKLNKVNISLQNKPDMIEVSRQIHWYVETEPEEITCNNRIVPYLDAFEPSVCGFGELEKFIESMVQEVISPSHLMDVNLVDTYLDILRSSSGGGTGYSTGGLIINVTDKGIKYVQIADFSQLRLQHKKYVQEIEQMNESVMKLENELVQKRTISRNRSQSYGLSMK